MRKKEHSKTTVNKLNNKCHVCIFNSGNTCFYVLMLHNASETLHMHFHRALNIHKHTILLYLWTPNTVHAATESTAATPKHFHNSLVKLAPNKIQCNICNTKSQSNIYMYR